MCLNVQEEHVDHEGGNASQAGASGAPDHYLTERADSFEAPDLARCSSYNFACV